MSTTQQAVTEAMASYEDDPAIEGEVLEADELEKDPVIEAKPEPHHMTLEEWTEKGNDPDKYRGKKAFDDYGIKQAEMKRMQDQMSVLTEATVGLKEQYQREADERVERAKEVAKQELIQAREDEDIPAVEAAKDRIAALDKPATPVQATRQLNPVLSEFLNNNPLLNKESPQFDAEFFADWSMSHDSKLDALLGGNRDRSGELTQGQIERSMNFALRAAKDLHADKFVSPRNKRVAPTKPASKRETSNNTGDYKTRLKGMTTNSLNKNDTTGTLDMYEYILKNHSQKDADEYAAKVLGDK